MMDFQLEEAYVVICLDSSLSLFFQLLDVCKTHNGCAFELCAVIKVWNQSTRFS
jgi:hypothetical protein